MLRIAMSSAKNNNLKSDHKVLLMIATDFPPLAGTNTQRIQSFAKYLDGFGWQAQVLTHEVEDLYLIDSKELDEIPERVLVHRVASPDLFKRLRRMRGIWPDDLAKKRAKVAPSSSNAQSMVSPSAGLTTKLKNLVSWAVLKPLSAYFKRFVYIPDAERLWADAAYQRARQLVEAGQVTAVMTSCPAYSTHVAGLELKRSTGVFWVAEFRDLWVGRPGRVVKNVRQARLDAELEAAVVAECDHMIVASPAWVDNFAARYGEEIRAKITCITNGYDSAKMPEPAAPSQDNGILIVNTGAMYGSESPAPFLTALGQIYQETPGLLGGVRVELAGSAGDEKVRLDAIINAAGMEAIVSFLGVMPHRECLLAQQRADFLLLCNGQEHAETIRGRSFEYMASGKPILALTPKHGEQAKLLKKAGSSLLVDYGCVEATKEAMLKLLTAVRDGDDVGLKPNWDYIRQFDRMNLTKRLVEVIEINLNRYG